MQLHNLLIIAARSKASDIIIKVGQAPKFRRYGMVMSLQNAEPLQRSVVDQWIEHMMPPPLRGIYAEKGDVDFAYVDQVNTRFRINVFRQNGVQGFIARVVNSHIKSLEELGLPTALNKILKFKRGIVLVTGSVGSGKSTTLASMVQELNYTYPYHIITIEDPIEYLYEDERCVITQREVGVDTSSFEVALKASLRQSPDVIVLGEMRDRETIRTALMAAETGVLVLSTLHTMDVTQTLTRIMSFFGEADHNIIRTQLSRTLMMVVSQRLIPTFDNKSVAVAAEVMVANQRVREIIEQGHDINLIYEVIRKGHEYYGMQTFDQALFGLYQERKISKQMALHHAASAAELAAQMEGVA